MNSSTEQKIPKNHQKGNAKRNEIFSNDLISVFWQMKSNNFDGGSKKNQDKTAKTKKGEAIITAMTCLIFLNSSILVSLLFIIS